MPLADMCMYNISIYNQLLLTRPSGCTRTHLQCELGKAKRSNGTAEEEASISSSSTTSSSKLALPSTGPIYMRALLYFYVYMYVSAHRELLWSGACVSDHVLFLNLENLLPGVFSPSTFRGFFSQRT
jgi:hypothetical protein